MLKPLPLQHLIHLCSPENIIITRSTEKRSWIELQLWSILWSNPKGFNCRAVGGTVNMQGANCLRIEGRPPVGTQICREWVEWVAKCRHTCWACPASTIATTTCPLSSFYHCYYFLSTCSASTIATTITCPLSIFYNCYSCYSYLTTCPASTIAIYYYLSSYYITHLFLQLLANFYFCLYYALFRYHYYPNC